VLVLVLVVLARVLDVEVELEGREEQYDGPIGPLLHYN